MDVSRIRVSVVDRQSEQSEPGSEQECGPPMIQQPGRLSEQWLGPSDASGDSISHARARAWWREATGAVP